MIDPKYNVSPYGTVSGIVVGVARFEVCSISTRSWVDGGIFSETNVKALSCFIFEEYLKEYRRK